MRNPTKRISRPGAEARRDRTGIAGLTRVATVILVLSAAPVACKPKEIEVKPPTVAASAPTRQQVLAAHNDRAARLVTTYSDGVIELRWKDEDGEHTEQGDIELWQTTENRTAARISKLGEDIFWLGSKDSQWWLFDLMTKGDHVLYRGTHDQTTTRLVALGVKPLSLLDLLGITAWTANAADSAKPAEFDSKRRAWILPAQGRGGLLRAYLHQHDYTPSRIELLDSVGNVVAASELSRYDSVPVPNIAVMARPKMPRTVDIRLEAAAEGEFEGDVKIALNQTLGEIDPKQLAQIFDLDRLIAALRADRVEQAAATGTP